MLDKTAPDPGTMPKYFCASDMASARFGEVRVDDGKPTLIFTIACFLNEEIASGDGFPIHDIEIDVVRKSVPENRSQFLVQGPDGVEPGSENLLYQPLLLVRDEDSEGGYRMIDGLIRLNAQIRQGGSTVRCFILSPDLVEKKGHTPLAGLWTQRTSKETTPPDSKPLIFGSGETAPPVKAPIISTAHAIIRYLNPKAAHPDAISALPIAITAATTDERTKRVTVALDSIIPSPVEWPRLKRADQENLDVDLTFDPTLIRRRARAAMSFPELVLILYLLMLFQFIRRQSPDLKTNKAGHTIVSEDARYAKMVGAPKNIAETLKCWKKLRPGSGGPWLRPVHAGLAQIGLDWRTPHGVPAAETMRDHGFELIDAAFRALCLAETLRGHLHKVHSINGDKAPNSEEWRAILQLTADGIVYQATRSDFEVFWADRALLALHGRFNPAKIWRDTTRDTLLYEWLIAIGDLVRGKRMVVTCLMAQELFIVDDIRSVPGQEHAVAPEWDLFEAALALAAGDAKRLGILRRDLILRCVDAMRGKCAMVLTMPRDDIGSFGCELLERQESIYADTLTLET